MFAPSTGPSSIAMKPLSFRSLFPARAFAFAHRASSAVPGACVLLFCTLLLAAHVEYGHFPGGAHDGEPHQPVAAALFWMSPFVLVVLIFNVPVWLLLTGATWWRKEWGRNAWANAALFAAGWLVWILGDGSPLFIRVYYWLFG